MPRVKPIKVMTNIVKLQPYPSQLWLEDGTEVRLVPLNRTAYHPLYITRDGRPFAYVYARNKQTRLYQWQLIPKNPFTDTTAGGRYNAYRKQRYLKLGKTFGNILIHIAVALAWNGPQDTDEFGHPFQCHHLNGITMDNRHTNLIWLSRADHRRFDAALKGGLILSTNSLTA